MATNRNSLLKCKFWYAKLLFASFVTVFSSQPLYAYDFEVDGIYYNIIEDGGNVEVTYQYQYIENYSADIVIPQTVTYNNKTYSVTSIGNYAFCSCSSITSVSIPESMTSVGEYAFSGCSSLTSISIPESMTSIGNSAFSGCSSLTSISIPESVTYIGEYAFNACTSLTSISIPENVTSIEMAAFSGCSSLTSITVAANNPVYDSREGCNAIIETASNTLVVGCQNTIILESITSIGSWAFYNCPTLTSVSLPKSVTSIGEGAFYGCSSLTSISIPENVASIGRGAFSGRSSLTSITVAANNPVYDSREGCNAIIETASNTLITGCQNTIIPDGVTSIGDAAFDGCSSLTSISIPKGVTSIGDYAFENCSSLTSISIPEGVTNIGYSAFFSCYSLVSVSIPESITSIESETFMYCSSLTSISIPKGVTSIGRDAFFFCRYIVSIICYAENVPELESSVFGFIPLSEATLYVPASAIEAYKAADQWRDFGTILPLEDIPAGINNVSAKQDKETVYYTLDGVRIEKPTKKGIYIKNGKKVLIK